MAASMLTPLAAVLASGLLGLACTSTELSQNQDRPGARQPSKQKQPSRTPARRITAARRPAATPPPPAGVSKLQAPPTPEAAPMVQNWQDYVPREPMWLIVAAAGLRNSSFHPEDNRYGLLNWWRGDRAVDNLLTQIDEGYQVGARWFWIDRPMGTDGSSHVPAASWLTIDAEKRAEITTKLNDALLDRYDEPVNIVWFIGADMKDPRDIKGWTEREAHEHYKLGGGENYEQRIASRATLGGWLSTGAAGLGIDNSAYFIGRDHFVELFHQMLRPPFGITMYGESFPLKPRPTGGPETNADGTMRISMDHMYKMPWVATEQLIADRWPVTWEPGMPSLDKEKTRAFVWFPWTAVGYGNPEQRKQRARKWLDRGLIPITMDAVMFREAQEYFRAENN